MTDNVTINYLLTTTAPMGWWFFISSRRGGQVCGGQVKLGCVWGWGTRLLDSLLLSIYDVDALGGVCHAMALQVVNDF